MGEKDLAIFTPPLTLRRRAEPLVRAREIESVGQHGQIRANGTAFQSLALGNQEQTGGGAIRGSRSCDLRYEEGSTAFDAHSTGS